jgi:predicted MPP superfamily phosphohydrolase
MAIFRTVIFTLFFAVFMYVTHQLVRYADLSVGLSLFTVGFLVLLFGTVVAVPLLFWNNRQSHEVHKPWHDALSSAAHFGMAYISFLLTFVIVRDIVCFVLSYTNPEFVSDIAYGKEALGLMLALPFILLIVGTLIVRLGVKVDRITIPFENLAPELDGLRIAHITDLHISPGLPLDFVKNLAVKVNELKADIVVFTGDILDSHAIRHLPEFEILKTIEGKHGVFYVPGNHEYYWNIQESLAAFRAIGYKVLMNETSEIKINQALIQISGVSDPAARQFGTEPPDIPKVASQLKSEAFKIFLVHQPFMADQAFDKGFNLQLSGHTHGGQFFPWNFLIVFFQKYSKGLYRLKDMRLYVNQGTGYWGPSLRLGTYCELTEITLKKA